MTARIRRPVNIEAGSPGTPYTVAGEVDSMWVRDSFDAAGDPLPIEVHVKPPDEEWYIIPTPARSTQLPGYLFPTDTRLRVDYFAGFGPGTAGVLLVYKQDPPQDTTDEHHGQE